MEENCLICCQAYRSFEYRQFLPCSHNFHGHCLDQWLKINNSCPICRTVIPPSDGAQRDFQYANIAAALPTTTREIPFYLTANGTHLGSATRATPLSFQTVQNSLPTTIYGTPNFSTYRVTPIFVTRAQTAQLNPASVPSCFRAPVQSILPTANSETPVFSRTFLTVRYPTTSGPSVFSTISPTTIAPGNSGTPLLYETAPIALPTGLGENPKTSGTNVPYTTCETAVQPATSGTAVHPATSGTAEHRATFGTPPFSETTRTALPTAASGTAVPCTTCGTCLPDTACRTRQPDTTYATRLPDKTVKSHLPGLSDINLFTSLIVAFVSITLAAAVLFPVQNPAIMLTVLLAVCLLTRFTIFAFPKL